MKANIVDGDERGIGVQVIDNKATEHTVAVGFDGYVQGHSQDGYPDAAVQRTDEENEHVNQTRRYAKWHVYRERGYDTLDSTNNPDRLLAALIALARLDETTFAEQFGDLRRQVESHYDDGPVELPFPDADPDDVLVYRQDVFIKPDPVEFEPPVLEQYLGRFAGDSDTSALPSKDTLNPDIFDALDFQVEAVSGLHSLHVDAPGSEQTTSVDAPLDREPDARIELVPFDPAEIDSFHHYVVSHLAYQIRDCFLRMGVTPPTAFRTPGWGKYRAFHEQKFRPQYENYWDATADIDSWEPVP